MKPMDLKKLKVLNTRPKAQAEALNHMITQFGGIAISCPALAIEPTSPTWLAALPTLSQIHKAIFISANAVHFCFKALDETGLFWPEEIEIFAIGQATAQKLKDNGIRIDVAPSFADSEHLLAHPRLQKVAQEKILLFKGQGGRTLLSDTLKDRQAQINTVDVYSRTLPSLDQHTLISLWKNDAVDIILFTSQQAMQQLILLFGEPAKNWLCSKPCLVLSDRLAREAKQLGFQTTIISNPEGILDALYQFTQGIVHGR